MATKIYNRIVLFTGVLTLMLMPLKTNAETPQPKFYDGTRSDKFIEIDLHAGVGLCTILQNYSTAIPGLSDFLLSPGSIVRMGMNVRFDIRKSFGLGTGIDFGINNSHYAMSLISSNTGTISSLYVDNRYYDISVPVYLSFRLNLGRRMMWNVDGGIFLSNGFGGHTRVRGYTSGENSLGQTLLTPASYETKYFMSNKPVVNSVKRFDWGPRIATGLLYKQRYSLDAILQISAANLAKNSEVLNIRYRHLTFCVQLGYHF